MRMSHLQFDEAGRNHHCHYLRSARLKYFPACITACALLPRQKIQSCLPRKSSKQKQHLPSVPSHDRNELLTNAECHAECSVPDRTSRFSTTLDRCDQNAMLNAPVHFQCPLTATRIAQKCGLPLSQSSSVRSIGSGLYISACSTAETLLVGIR